MFIKGREEFLDHPVPNIKDIRNQKIFPLFCVKDEYFLVFNNFLRRAFSGNERVGWEGGRTDGRTLHTL